MNCLKMGAGSEGWKRFRHQGLGEHRTALPHQPFPRRSLTHPHSPLLSL